MEHDRPALRAFLGVFAAALLGFLAIGAVLPVLPRYVQDPAGPIGAGDVAVGVVIGAFAVTALLSRPIAGRLADARGRRVVATTGLVICGAAGGLLFVPAGVAWLVLARMVLGFGDGWMYTAAVTWSLDLAPERRRGQAIGLFGLAVWGGLSVGPIIGEALLRAGSYEAVWAFATAAPLAGALIASRLPDTHVRPEPGAVAAPLVVREAVVPGVALALGSAGFGAMAGFVVLHLADAGVGGGATVFATFATAVVVARLVAGGLPDRIGSARTAFGSACAEALGLVVIGLATSLPVALAGAAIMGVGFSLLFPSLALVVVQRVDERSRGAAMGTFTAFFDLGLGVGAPLAGAIAALTDYPVAFVAAGALAATGGLVGLVGTRRPAAPAPGPAAAPAAAGRRPDAAYPPG